MNELFKPASREKTKLRMALAGVSGGGKTLSALYIAYGLTGDWNKIALIDTEHKRALEYANRTDLPYPTGAFLYADMQPPYSVARYKQYVAAAAAVVGEDGVVIVDSLSHAWAGSGGVLEYKSQIAQNRGKNDYTAWDEAGKLQNDLIDTILSVPCHTICTLRVKQDYALQPNERGKLEPVKLGLAPVQRDSLEYEFDIVLNIARNHIATTGKDVTFLDGFDAVITPQLGADLGAWLNDGKEPVRYVCADCGKRIRDFTKKDGTLVSAQACAEQSSDMCGRMLCTACLVKVIKARKEAGHDTGKAAQSSQK